MKQSEDEYHSDDDLSDDGDREAYRQMSKELSIASGPNAAPVDVDKYNIDALLEELRVEPTTDAARRPGWPERGQCWSR